MNDWQGVVFSQPDHQVDIGRCLNDQVVLSSSMMLDRVNLDWRSACNGTRKKRLQSSDGDS